VAADVVKMWDWLRERWPYRSIVDEHDRRLEVGLNDQTEEDLELPPGMGEVTPIRKIQPGDILDVVIKLRQLMSFYETCSFTLYAGFDELGGEVLNKEVEKTRHTLELATARVAALLASIERTPYYVDLRRETLARRRDRANPARVER
jgi:hypothetical protein